MKNIKFNELELKEIYYYVLIIFTIQQITNSSNFIPVNIFFYIGLISYALIFIEKIVLYKKYSDKFFNNKFIKTVNIMLIIGKYIYPFFGYYILSINTFSNVFECNIIDKSDYSIVLNKENIYTVMYLLFSITLLIISLSRIIKLFNKLKRMLYEKF